LLHHYRLGRKVRTAVRRAVVVEHDSDEASVAAVWQLARCECLHRPGAQLSARVLGDDPLTYCCWLHGATLPHDAPAVKGLAPLLGSDMSKQRRSSSGTGARLLCPDTSNDASAIVADARVRAKAGRVSRGCPRPEIRQKHDRPRRSVLRAKARAVVRRERSASYRSQALKQAHAARGRRWDWLGCDACQFLPSMANLWSTYAALTLDFNACLSAAV